MKRSCALAQADADDLAKPGRGDERVAVVELDAPRHPVAAPQPPQRGEHALVAAVADDLDPGVVGSDVDLVERVEAHAAVEMARPDQIDLHHVTDPASCGRGVGDPLRRAPAGPLTHSGAGALEDTRRLGSRRCDGSFPDAGGPFSSRALGFIVKPIMLAAGVPAEFAHPHVLRHTYGTLFMRRPGSRFERLRQLMGHASIDTTAVYVHHTHDDLEQAVLDNQPSHDVLTRPHEPRNRRISPIAAMNVAAQITLTPGTVINRLMSAEPRASAAIRRSTSATSASRNSM